jgi:hypothetical protein
MAPVYDRLDDFTLLEMGLEQPLSGLYSSYGTYPLLTCINCRPATGATVLIADGPRFGRMKCTER